MIDAAGKQAVISFLMAVLGTPETGDMPAELEHAMRAAFAEAAPDSAGVLAYLGGVFWEIARDAERGDVDIPRLLRHRALAVADV